MDNNNMRKYIYKEINIYQNKYEIFSLKRKKKVALNFQTRVFI